MGGFGAWKRRTQKVRRNEEGEEEQGMKKKRKRMRERGEGEEKQELRKDRKERRNEEGQQEL